MKTIHIASTSDAGYFPGLEVLVVSTLLQVSRETAVHFHILDGGISGKNWDLLRQHCARFHPKAFIHRLAFSEERFAGFPTLSGNKMTYARLLLGEYLPELDKILYLDSDILMGRDPEELFDQDMQGNTALAADDAFIFRLDGDCPWLPASASQLYRYFNAGVLLLDLNRWRKFDYLNQCFSAIAAKSSECRFCDQTALNYILRDDIKRLPQICNYVTYLTEALPREPANIHVVGEKPWIKHVFRCDHLLWRAFYAEVIDPDRQWSESSSFVQKLLQWLAFTPAFNWVFVVIMKFFLIPRARHEHQRRTRVLALRTGREAPGLIQQARTEWRMKLKSLSPPPSANPVPLQPVISLSSVMPK